ncbi:MAG TPA: hypothetical protein VL425_02610 [Rudaea sp.]|nr:hypothetical protein [Rudaea sp.]
MAFLVGLTGFGAGFFAATFLIGLAGLDGLRDAAFGAGLCAGFFAAAFFTGLADFFAAGFFAGGLRLEFAMLLTTLSLSGRVL